jgi:hypothetical protein
VALVLIVKCAGHCSAFIGAELEVELVIIFWTFLKNIFDLYPFGMCTRLEELCNVTRRLKELCNVTRRLKELCNVTRLGKAEDLRV